jgi:hypothetical protein
MVILYLKKSSYSVALMLKWIIQAHLTYRKKLAEFTRVNRFSVRCAVFKLPTVKKKFFWKFGSNPRACSQQCEH